MAKIAARIGSVKPDQEAETEAKSGGIAAS
jgi:hypothetical protein